jgi:hypothetical protein
MVAAPQVGAALSPGNVIFIGRLKLDDRLVVTKFILKQQLSRLLLQRFYIRAELAVESLAESEKVALRVED